ncbi:MAG: FAD:protein FMN transferase [Bacteroidales bacterium]|nr:FAD:protein FMN transferase [Bacteroidales bacterium]
MRRIFLGCLILVLLAGSLVSCSNGEKRYEFDGMVQGTYYHIVVYSTDSTGMSKGFDSIFNIIDQSVSLWEKNSTVCKVNRNEDVELDQAFIDNFLAAKDLNILSEGALDITVGALVREYGFTTKARSTMSQQQIDSMLQYTGMENLKIEGKKIVKKYPETQIDFNAIAQGYTTDLITKYLDKRGCSAFLIDVGGEVFARGIKPDKKKWNVAIEKPAKSKEEERTYNTIVLLENESIVTSGNYRKYYEEGGVKYSHTIDPKTGKPVRHSLLSASVIAKDATTADGLATAFMVMGLEKAKEFLVKHKEYNAYFIYSDEKGEMKVWHNPGFARYIAE